jgi:hypothetical protein
LLRYRFNSLLFGFSQQQMNRYLVYQAFGTQDTLHELVFSIYSVLEVCNGVPDFQIVVYTDNLAWLKTRLPDWVLRYPMPASLLQQWAGPEHFTGRVRIKMLTDFLEHHNGSVLYTDNDTRFLKNPEILFEKIEQGIALMYSCEGKISQRNTFNLYKLDNFLKANPDLGISNLSSLYNDGIIGIQTKQLQIINSILTLTDRLYKLLPAPLVEPLAFSWMLGRHFELGTAEQVVYHYSNFKEFRGVLNHFFTFYADRHWAELVDKIYQIEPMQLQKPKLEFENLPLLKKTWRMFNKQPWKMPNYTLI